MFSRRIIKNEKRKRRGKLLVLLIFFLFLAAIVAQAAFYLHKTLNKKLFISPLPKVMSQTKPASVTERLKKEVEVELEKKSIEYKSVSVESTIIKIILEGAQEVIFDINKPLSLQTSSLQLMLSRLTIEGKRFSKIDFRNDLPIITFK